MYIQHNTQNLNGSASDVVVDEFHNNIIQEEERVFGGIIIGPIKKKKIKKKEKDSKVAQKKEGIFLQILPAVSLYNYAFHI